MEQQNCESKKMHILLKSEKDLRKLSDSELKYLLLIWINLKKRKLRRRGHMQKNNWYQWLII